MSHAPDQPSAVRRGGFVSPLDGPLHDAPADLMLARLRDRLDPVAHQDQIQPSRGDYDLNAELAPARRAGVRPLTAAAVLAPLVLRDGHLHLLLTVRANHLAKHAGQVSFPGGRRDQEDGRMLDTALREAHEEIGLAPAQVEVLGAFDAYETGTGYAVTPFVGLLAPDFVPAPSADEVADVFEAPFSFLMNPANHRVSTAVWRGEARRFYEMPYGERRIWGATAGMLRVLHERLSA